MPPGYVHLNLWKKYLPVGLLLAVGAAFLSAELALGVLLGYLSGYFIDPDLDQLSMTAGEGRILRNFKIFGAIFLGVWLPYAYLFTHRGISHTPVLGSLTRLLYLDVVVSLMVRPTLAEWLQWHAMEYLILSGLIIGLSTADLVHSAADFGWIKVRWQKPRARKPIRRKRS